MNPKMHESTTRPRIVIVGGGVAGLQIATALGRRWKRRPDSPSITLVDCRWTHVWKPMLHTIAAGTNDLTQQQTPFIAQAADAGFTYRAGKMIGLDRKARQVLIGAIAGPGESSSGAIRREPYDKLIIAVGSQINDYGTPGASRHCLVIDSPQQAETFNQVLRSRIEQCIDQDAMLHVGIVGGGATGVQLAAELVQMADVTSTLGDYDLSSRLKISIIESGRRLLPAFPENISSEAEQRLSQLGVQIKLGARVSTVTGEGFILSTGEKVDANLKVWAAGVKGPDCLADLDGLESTPTNQLIVKPSLQTTLDSNIFAVGDAASLLLPGATSPLPPTAQIAHQHAKHLIDHLPAHLAQAMAIPDFVYLDYGALVSLAKYAAYGTLGNSSLFHGATISGYLARLGHGILYRRHQAHLRGTWKSGLLWLVDILNRQVRPTVRLD